MKKLAPILIILLAFYFTKDKAMARPIAVDTTKSKKTTTDTTKQKLAKADSSKQAVRTVANLKSGTSQDVLTSFFKLAYQDLNDGHHFQFTSSLFAIKAKTDTTLWIDTNYRKNVFLRNSTIGIDVGLDSTNKFKSATLSYKYAIINHRDRSVFEFVGGGKLLDSCLKVANMLYAKALIVYKKEQPGHNYDLAEGYFFPLKLKSGTTAKRPPLDSVPHRFANIVDSIKNEKAFAVIKNFKALSMFDSLKSNYNVLSGLLAQQSLWTAGIQVSTNQMNKFATLNFNTEYLKGITHNNTSMGLELDIKGGLNIYDTTAMNVSYNRNVLSGSAGINWIIYKDKKTQKSYVEFKPALTYNNVLTGMLPGETKSKFTGDGILRFRITDDLWVPFDIKYDPKAGKFFGFLNITSNFDWLGASKSKATGSN